MSDQIFQTLSGDAVVSTEVPYSAISSPHRYDVRRITNSTFARILGDGYRPDDDRRCPLSCPVEKEDHGQQQRSADQLGRVDRLVEAPRRRRDRKSTRL